MLRFLIAFTVIALPAGAFADGAARSFTHTVGTTASKVAPPDGSTSYDSIRCWQPGATPVYLGGADVTASNGYPICLTTPGTPSGPKADVGPKCASDTFKMKVSELHAVTSSGQQFLTCIVSLED